MENEESSTTQRKPTGTALAHFKDWSNYLLVTTIAAAGWVASNKADVGEPWKSLSLWSFGFSAIFGIMTLALVPLIAQQLENHRSIYEVQAQFHLFKIDMGVYLPQACRPQHFAFISGITFYCIGSTAIPWIGLIALIVAPLAFLYAGPPRDRRP